MVIPIGKYANGRQKYKWHGGHKTKKEAQRELARLLNEVHNGTYVEPSRFSVAEYLRHWLETYARPKVAARTLERYEEIVQNHLIPSLGHYPLAKLQPLHIQTCYKEALESGRRNGKGGLSHQTVLHHHRVLDCALKWAVKWQILARNPADFVDAPKAPHREMKALDQDGTVRLLATAEGTRLYLPVLIAVTTGMRLGEILGLSWDDVDLKSGVLQVRRALQETRAGLSLKEPKTERSRRTINIPTLLVEALVKHKGELAGRKLILGGAWQEHKLVIPGESGSPLSPKVISKAFEHLAQRAGCPEIRFHDLRHSSASQLLGAGVPVGVVSARLGHARTSTTHDIYGHCLPGQQEEAARLVEQGLRAALERQRSLRLA